MEGPISGFVEEQGKVTVRFEKLNVMPKKKYD